MKKIQRLWIGIDWGTHSSKWWYSAELGSGKRVEPPKLPGVVDSTIYRLGDDLLIGRERARIPRDLADVRLKRLLLRDPQGASYWDATREGIGISLGEAATLTIGCILGDIAAYLADENLLLDPSTEVNFRFSLPNWIGNEPDHLAARKRMYQTSVICVGLVKSLGWERLPKVGKKTSLADWRETIKVVRQIPEVVKCLERGPSSFAEMVETEYALDRNKWRLAA